MDEPLLADSGNRKGSLLVHDREISAGKEFIREGAKPEQVSANAGRNRPAEWSRIGQCLRYDTGDSDMTLNRGWVYGEIAFREEMRSLVKKPPSVSFSHKGDEEMKTACMAMAERSFGLTKEEILSKKKSSPEIIVLGMILKVRTGLSHQDIANYLNMGYLI